MIQSTPRRLNILLVDDHSFIREGLKALVNAQPDMQVIGEASEGGEGLKRAMDFAPDVVIMDVSMPGMNGTDATREMQKCCPRTKVLALSMHEDVTYLRGLLEAGASGYVLKRSAPQELVNAIRNVAAGGTHLDPALAGKVAASFVRRAPLGDGKPEQALSEREEIVLRLISRGYTNKEIGERLSISMKTVEGYKARAMQKLGMVSRTDIIRYAAQQGWLKDF